MRTLNVLLAALWIGVVIAIGRENARRAGESDLQLADEPEARSTSDQPA
jgi:hypothetical protein